MIIEIQLLSFKWSKAHTPLFTENKLSLYLLKVDPLLGYTAYYRYVILLWDNGKRNRENPLYYIHLLILIMH